MIRHGYPPRRHRHEEDEAEPDDRPLDPPEPDAVAEPNEDEGR